MTRHWRIGVGIMPSTLRWTYKGKKQEHHGEQRIELGDLVIDDEHSMGNASSTDGPVMHVSACANTATEWC